MLLNIEIKEIASSEEEEYTDNKKSRYLQINKKKEINIIYNKPVIPGSPDTFTNEDWGIINPINK